MTRRKRVSTSAGLAVSRMMSSAPHSAVTTVRPPSVSTRISGTVRPVARSRRHVVLAVTRSRRASSTTMSASGASTRADGSTGSTRTRWDNRPRAGSTWAEPPDAGVSSSRSATWDLPACEWGPRYRARRRSCAGMSTGGVPSLACAGRNAREIAPRCDNRRRAPPLPAGRSPARAPGPVVRDPGRGTVGDPMQLATRAVVTAALAAAVAVAGYLGGLPLSIAAAVLAVVFALGWPSLAGLPFVAGSATVVALGGVGAVAVVHLTDTQPFLRYLPVVFAAAILLAFVSELVRRDGRTRLVESVSGTVAGTLVAVAVAGWVAIGKTAGGEPLVVVGALALAVGSAVVALH